MHQGMSQATQCGVMFMHKHNILYNYTIVNTFFY